MAGFFEFHKYIGPIRGLIVSLYQTLSTDSQISKYH